MSTDVETGESCPGIEAKAVPSQHHWTRENTTICFCHCMCTYNLCFALRPRVRAALDARLHDSGEGRHARSCGLADM